MSKQLTEYNKLVKRINERIADIGREYGDTVYYKDIEDKIKSLLSDRPDLYHYSKSGYIALPTSEKYKDVEELQKLIEQLDTRKTKGQIKERLRKKYAEEYGEEIEESEIQAYARRTSLIREFMDKHAEFRYEDDDLKIFYREAKSSENNYSDDEIAEWIEWYENKTATISEDENLVNPWE